MQVIREELEEVKRAVWRRTAREIMHSQQDLTLEDLITEEDMVVTLSHGSYARPASRYLPGAASYGGER